MPYLLTSETSSSPAVAEPLRPATQAGVDVDPLGEFVTTTDEAAITFNSCMSATFRSISLYNPLPPFGYVLCLQAPAKMTVLLELRNPRSCVLNRARTWLPASLQVCFSLVFALRTVTLSCTHNRVPGQCASPEEGRDVDL